MVILGRGGWSIKFYLIGTGEFMMRDNVFGYYEEC